MKWIFRQIFYCVSVLSVLFTVGTVSVFAEGVEFSALEAVLNQNLTLFLLLSIFPKLPKYLFLIPLMTFIFFKLRTLQ